MEIYLNDYHKRVNAEKIPTLYGDEARRFRDMAEETERKFDMRPKRDLTTDSRYQSMRLILDRSNLKI